MIAILDLSIGNLRSVARAIDEVGFDAEIIRDSARFDDLTHLIMPGVGHFRAAIEEIDRRNLRPALTAYRTSGRPLLGLCLGMQILADEGLEGGSNRGLAFVPGIVERLPDKPNFPVPHVGWNGIDWRRAHPLTEGLKTGRDFYFVHSYVFRCANPDDVIGAADYDGDFAAVIGHGNVVGCQFHPEKSQVNGLKILENFCRWDGAC